MSPEGTFGDEIDLQFWIGFSVASGREHNGTVDESDSANIHYFDVRGSCSATGAACKSARWQRLSRTGAKARRFEQHAL
jgi:hypothetical protein